MQKKEGKGRGSMVQGVRVWNAVGLGVDVVGSTLESILAPLCWVQLGQRGDLKTEALCGFLCFFWALFPLWEVASVLLVSEQRNKG